MQKKDYIINDARLSKIISNVALKNKDDLLENDITFEVSNADRIVLTDAKWMEFMLNQIVNNSIKVQRIRQRRSRILRFRQQRIRNVLFLKYWIMELV